MSERIVAAAIKWGDLVCFTEKPGRHHHVFKALEACGWTIRGPFDHGVEQEQGFVTSTGRFVDRETGRKIAEAIGQLIAGEIDSTGVPIVKQHSQLFSEDVW